MTYVDGFVIPTPKKPGRCLQEDGDLGKKVWMKHGALQYFECVADDLKAMPGCGDFQKMVKLKRGETLWYSFIVYKSKAHRNAVNKKVMAEMQKHKMPTVMPFDLKRMAHGGFKTVVQG